MLQALDRRLSLRLVIALFPLAFLIHDSEEILITSGWMARHQDQIRALVERLPLSKSLLAGAAMTTGQWAVAVFTLLILVCLLTWLGLRALPTSVASPAFIAGVAILGLNVYTHVAQSVLLGGYTPGVVTAVLVSLPYSVYALRRLRQAGLLTRRTLVVSALSGAAIILPLVLLVQAVGRWLA